MLKLRLVVLLAAAVACGDRGADAPALQSLGPDASLASSRGGQEGWEGAGHHAERLTAFVGKGHGWFRAVRIPHPTTPGNFAIHVQYRLRGVKPNTTYLLQRSPETFSPPGPPAGFDIATTLDGSCQRVLAVPPWSTMSPLVPTFATWTPTLTTDRHGNGEAEFDFLLAFPLPLFDVMFRAVESGPAPTSALYTDCTTVPL